MLELRDIHRQWDHRPLLAGVGLQVPPGRTVARFQRRNCTVISPRLMASSTSRLISIASPNSPSSRHLQRLRKLRVPPNEES